MRHKIIDKNSIDERAYRAAHFDFASVAELLFGHASVDIHREPFAHFFYLQQKLFIGVFGGEYFFRGAVLHGSFCLIESDRFFRG